MPVSYCCFLGWGLPASLTLWESQLWGLPLLDCSPCSLQVMCQNAHELRCLAASHRWCLTLCPKLIHGAASLRARLTATLSHHPSLLHLPVLLQRLLQHHLCALLRHPSPPLSLLLTMMASPWCRAGGAVLAPFWSLWMVSPAHKLPHWNWSSLHSVFIQDGFQISWPRGRCYRCHRFGHHRPRPSI